MSDVVRDIIGGVAWTTAAKIFGQVTGFVVSVVLARLLVPEDFGLLGMILVITGFVSLFGELGFAEALVQRETIEERHRSSVFWLNILTGAALAFLIASCAPLVAWFYEDARLEPLTLVISLNFLLAPFSMVQRALLTRDMKFRALATVELLRVLVPGAVAIALAYRGFGVWSLIAQTLLATTVAVPLLWWLSSWRPSLRMEREALRDLLGFSANLLGFKTINYWARQVDDLLIGKIIGAAPLGLYTRAYATMMLPLNEVTSVLSTVMFPALSKIQQDRAQVKSIYLRAIAMIAFITFPLMLGLFVAADSFVLAVYGEKWAGMIDVLRILCVVGLYQSIGTTVGWIYKSQGRTDWMFRWGLVASLLIIASILAGISFGTIEAVALAYALMTGLVLLWPQFAIPGKLIGMKVHEVLASVASPLACAVAMAGAMAALDRWVLASAELTPWPRFGSLAGFGIAVYLAIALLFRIRPVRELRAFIAKELAS